MNRLLPCLLLIAALAVWASEPTHAQILNTRGPGDGEITYMSQTPYPVSDTAFVPTSVRAIGVSGPDSTRWGFIFIGLEGTHSTETVHFTAGNRTYEALSVSQPDEPGPVTVFVSQQTYFTLMESSNAAAEVGDRTLPLPNEAKQDMKAIRSSAL